MYCKICGQDGPDDVDSCVYCGFEFDSKDKRSKIIEEPALDISENEPAANKKNRMPMPLLISIVCFILVGVIIALFFLPGFGSTTIRFISSPSGLMGRVYRESIEKAISQAHMVSSWSSGDGISAKYYVDIDNREDVLSLLAEAMEAESKDIEGLSDIRISCDATYQNELLKAIYNLSLNEQEIIAMEQYVDRAKMQQWILFPELSDQPLFIDMDDEEISSSMSDPDAYTLVQIAPELLEEVSVYYTQMLIDGFENVNKSNMTVSYNGISQRMTVLKATISTRKLCETLTLIIDDAAMNPTVASIIYDMEVQMKQEYYTDFLNSLKREKMKLEELEQELDPYSQFTLHTYLNRYNEIAGIKLEYAEDGTLHQIFSCITVTKGNQFAAELVMWDGLMIEGMGIAGDQINGTFSFFNSDQLICKVVLTDFVCNSSNISGAVSMIPAEEIVEQLMDEIGCYQAYLEAGRLRDLSAEIVLDCNSDHKKIRIALCADKKIISSITVFAESKGISPITVPQNTVIPTDNTDAEQWRSGMEKEAVEFLIDRLVNAGISRELLTEAPIAEDGN